MFGFEQWDSPISLALEVLLSLAIVVGLIFVVRRVNAQAEADRQRYLQSRNPPATSEKQAAPSDATIQATDENIEGG